MPTFEQDFYIAITNRNLHAIKNLEATWNYKLPLIKMEKINFSFHSRIAPISATKVFYKRGDDVETSILRDEWKIEADIADHLKTYMRKQKIKEMTNG